MKRPSSDYCLAVGLAALVLIAIAFLAVFLAPDQTVQASIILVDHNNSTTPLRLPLAKILRWMSLGASIILFVLAMAGYARRSRLIPLLSIVLDDVHDYGREVAAEIRGLLSPGERWKPAVLGVFFAVGLALRIAALDAPMRYDESYTFNYHGLRDVLNIVSDYTTPNNHIFQSVLVHFSYQWFGASPIALRLPALLAGLLLVPASFWLLRRLFDDGIALISAGLVALSAPLISYSANARGYTWLTLLFLLGLTLATRLREKRNLAAWGLFAIVFVLGFFTIPVMLYGYALVSVWMLLSAAPKRRRALLAEWVIASAAVVSLVVLLYTPAAVRCTVQNIVANPFVRPLSFSVWATYFPTLPGGLAEYGSSSFPFAVRILLLGGLTVSLLLPGDRGRQARRLHASVLLAVLPIMVVQQVVPFLRVLMFLLPIYSGLAVVGLAGLIDWAPRSLGSRSRRPVFVTAVLAVVLLGAGLLYNRQPPGGLFTDLPNALDGLKPLLADDDRIVAGVPLSEPLIYHAERAGLPRRAVHKFLPYWGDRQLNCYATIYFVEEKNPPKRAFGRLKVGSLRVSHPAFETYFEPPEQVGESEFTTWYRLRRNKNEL